MNIYKHIINLVLVVCTFSPSFSYSNTSPAETGKVIFLIGTSSAGKSTLGKEFASSRENVIFFEHDKRWAQKELAFLTEQLGDPFKHFFTIYDSALIEMSFRNRKCQHIAKRIEESPEQEELISLLDSIKAELGPLRKRFYDETTREFIEGIPRLINEGKIILIDKIIMQEDINALSTFDPLYIVVYYPFTQLPRRIWMRNQDAIARNDSYDYRHYLEAFLQYVYLFEARPFSNKDALETLSDTQITHTLSNAFHLDTHYLDLDDFYILSDHFDLLKYCSNVLATLKIDPGATYDIVSRFGCDLVIRTDKLNPQEACQRLEKFLSDGTAIPDLYCE